MAHAYLKYQLAPGSELCEQVSAKPSGNMLGCTISEQSSLLTNKHSYDKASVKTPITVKFERKQQESHGQAGVDVKVESSWNAPLQCNYLTMQLVIAVS